MTPTHELLHEARRMVDRRTMMLPTDAHLRATVDAILTLRASLRGLKEALAAVHQDGEAGAAQLALAWNICDRAMADTTAITGQKDATP